MGFLEMRTLHFCGLHVSAFELFFLNFSGFTYHPGDFPAGSEKLANLTRNLNLLSAQVQSQTAPYVTSGNGTGGPLWISLQDHVGAMPTDPLYNQTATAIWFKYLENFAFKNLSMNVERFMQNPYNKQNNLVASDCQETKDREDYYVNQGFALGPSFEMRYWLTCNHAGSPRVCNNGWSYFNEFCYQVGIFS